MTQIGLMTPLLIWWWLIPLGGCAGIAVHLSIASRVSDYFPDDVRELDGSILAGSFYPDALYNCFGLNDAAEEAHWPPFLLRMVENYKSCGNKDLNIKAFIYGMFTHQIADVSWHSLHKAQGLLDYLSATEFGDAKTEAHTFLDTGGDFLVLSREFGNLDKQKKSDLLHHFLSEWNIPVDPLILAYRQLGYDVSATEIMTCMVRGYSGLRGELDSFRTSAPPVQHRSPLLNEILVDYYFGGIDDIVDTIRGCLDALSQFFDSDEGADPWKVCSIFQPNWVKRNEQTAAAKKSSRNQTLEIQRAENEPLTLWNNQPNSKFGSSLLYHESISAEAELIIGAEYDLEGGSVFVVPLAGLLDEDQIDTECFTDLSTDLSYGPRFGHRVTSWKITQYPFTVISEPGMSRIFVYLDSQLVAVLVDYNASTKLGSGGPKELGSFLATDDINGDGICDLIVTSPHYDQEGVKQKGIVKIISGSVFLKQIESILLSLQSTESNPLFFDIDELTCTEFNLPESFELKEGYDQFGTSLSFTNESVFIGSLGIGSVLVYDKLGNYKERLSNVVSKPDGSRVISQESGLFAFGASISGEWESHEWVLVFASAQLSEFCFQCGCGYLYMKRGDFDLVATIQPKWGFSVFFGVNAIKNGDSVFVAGDGYMDGAGAIWEINIDTILQQSKHQSGIMEVKLSDFKEQYGGVVIKGKAGTGYSGFGRSLETFSYKMHKYLAVGMPFYGYGTLNRVIGGVEIHMID
ncbi:hypothetical protein OGAPHI_006428 [Ogataea philodendri]|uniref:Phospholipase C/D domain-containing protein n=1 Tax=Ogataea philodendri TaxID=1378263 RepID=A0A9P8T155_9ASCO|nr:uncharacterized protein OGAPHI_006428 [Ogataea philodendri]KAH3661580.1 hypothetical protein OGAPHI_006428 [Ogataea philodendri]